MKILQLGKLYPPTPGGIENITFELAKGISRQSHQGDVLCVNDVGAPTVIERRAEGTIYRCRSFFKFASVYFSLTFFYYWFFLRNKYDIIHIHCPNPLANLALLIFPTKAKVCVHWHSDIVKQKRLKKIYDPFQRRLLTRADAIIVTTEVYATSSNDLQHVRKKVVAIPLGIDPNTMENDLCLQRKIRSAYQGKKIIFSLGRHVYYKGFEFLIEAVGHLSDEYVLLLGGSGEVTSELQKKTKELALEERVVFLGNIPREELGSYYAECDVFCLPSVERSEAFGIVQLEAMSQGSQVVSTAIPGSGVSWVNKDGRAGKVVPPRDSTAISVAIKKLCQNPISSTKIKKYFLDNFTSSLMVERTLKLYSELLTRREN